MDEKPKRIPRKNPDDFPCPVCGSEEFRWGFPISQGFVYFNVKESAITGGNERLEARACVECGNVLLFLRD